MRNERLPYKNLLIKDEPWKTNPPRISFYGHELDPITVNVPSQQDIIDRTKALVEAYRSFYNYSRDATVEFSNLAVQLLLESSYLEGKVGHDTVTFLQKNIHDITMDSEGVSNSLKGIIREANFLHIALGHGFNLYNSAHLDMKHKIDFVVANENTCLPVNVKGDTFNSQKLLEHSPPVWIVGVAAKFAQITNSAVLYQFPFYMQHHRRENHHVLKQLGEGMQTKEVVRDLLPPPSDPSLSLDKAQCYRLH